MKFVRKEILIKISQTTPRDVSSCANTLRKIRIFDSEMHLLGGTVYGVSLYISSLLSALFWWKSRVIIQALNIYWQARVQVINLSRKSKKAKSRRVEHHHPTLIFIYWRADSLYLPDWSIIMQPRNKMSAQEQGYLRTEDHYFVRNLKDPGCNTENPPEQ